MRALGKRGPGIFPKRFRPLLRRERDLGMWPSFAAWVGRTSAADLTAAHGASRNVLSGARSAVASVIAGCGRRPRCWSTR